MANSKKRLKIAIIAPPWLSLYPGCYYGIENVIHHLATELTRNGHKVELFTVGGSKTKVTKIHWYHRKDQYPHIHRRWYEVVPIIISHILYSLNIIREDGNFDIIHDHNSFLGPAIMAHTSMNLPPVLHTLHEPFADRRTLSSGIPDNRLMFKQFRSIKNLYFNCVSNTQARQAPAILKPRIKRVVYNGVNPNEYHYTDKKDDYFLIVARVSPNKGQAVAAKACYELGQRLKIAGTVGSEIDTPKKLMTELSKSDSPYMKDVDFRYFKAEIAKYLKPGQIEYLGAVFGEPKLNLFTKAKAFLFPIDWEEPFGMAILDALASGTPVIAYNKGAMPEIIEHGKNGFIAKNYRELKHYMKRVGEIDPAVCRKSVEDKFSTKLLAERYIKLYNDIIDEHSRLVENGAFLQFNHRPNLGSSSLEKTLEAVLLKNDGGQAGLKA